LNANRRSELEAKMRKWFLATTALVALSVPAMAADMGIVMNKAPLSTPAYDWSGFYVGLNVGAGWGNTTATLTEYDGESGSLPLASLPLSGFIGGGQVGYNFAITPSVLVGLEASFDALGINGTGPCLVEYTCTDRATWEADIAARLGFSYQTALIYIKGGAAWAHFNHTISDGRYSESLSETPLGWLVGAGVEYAFQKNWTAKLEYDFIDFQGANLADNSGDTVNTSKSLSLIKAGVNYKF
jgi:outer membrane immunogenic protein